MSQNASLNTELHRDHGDEAIILVNTRDYDVQMRKSQSHK